MTAVIFDLDGTLIDSAPSIHKVANDVLALKDLAPLGGAEVRSFIGNGAGILVSRVMAARGLPDDAGLHAWMLAEFIARYEDEHSLTTLYPGAVAALGTLAGRGHTLALCTNKPHGPTLSTLRHFGLDGTFAAVTAGDSLPERKPHPAPLLHTVAALGNPAAVFVGDSEVDAETAEAAGLPFLLFTEGYRRGPPSGIPHRAAFADWRDLPALVAEAAPA